MQFIMNFGLLAILMFLEPCLGFPQYTQLPQFRPIPPEEVNDFRMHRQYTRSIASPQLPSLNDLQETVKEVEAMIKANPELPRLTRGEILDLLENITKADFNKAKIHENGSERDPKAIMVVQAYTPENDVNNMEELFTKPPVTHIVAAQPDAKEDSNVESKLQDQFNPNHNDINKSTFDKPKKSRGDHRRRTSTTETTSSTTTTTTISELPSTQASFRPTYSSHHRRRRPQIRPNSQVNSTSVIVDHPITTYSPKFRRPVVRKPTTTEKHPNHRYPGEKAEEPTTSITYSKEGIKVITPPKLVPYVNGENTEELKKIGAASYQQKASQSVSVKPAELNTAVPILGIEVPEHLKGLLSEMVLGNPQEQKPSTPAEGPIIPTAEDAKIQHMLAVFRSPSFMTTTTTTTMPDISNVADNLTPEMRDLLMSFGLMPNPQEHTTTQSSYVYSSIKAEVKPESYIGFKPLPDDGPTRAEMEDFLARFGLGRSGRNIKSTPKKNEDKLEVDVVPESYQGVLEDIGIVGREGKMIRSEALTLEKQQHVFSPEDTKYASKEELEKLNKLLSIIKQLEQLNRTATDEDLKKIDTESLKELVNSLNVENQENHIVPLEMQNAPNPLNFELGFDKNEFKRQESSNINDTKEEDKNMEDVKTTSSSIITTTEEAKTPNLKDLEDSFGGQTDPPTEAPAPETTTALRKTGFYMLIDWNTFLDIDDQKGKRVNLRFQPTIGDPKRFYSVTVP